MTTGTNLGRAGSLLATCSRPARDSSEFIGVLPPSRRVKAPLRRDGGCPPLVRTTIAARTEWACAHRI